MAHKKATAANASQKANRPGKHRGVQKSDGQFVTSGTTIIRQLGTVYLSGENTSLSRDFSIFALHDGKVKFSTINGGRKKVSIIRESVTE